MIVPATLFFAFVASAWAQAQINTPASLLQCQPALINWTGGQAPYFLSIIPGGQPSGTPLKQFPQTSDTSLTWVVDIAAGTSVTFQIRDNTGAVNFSDQVTIGEGVSSDCLAAGQNTAASTVADGAAAGNTGAASSSAAAAATTSSSSSSEMEDSSSSSSMAQSSSSMMMSSSSMMPSSSMPASSSRPVSAGAQSASATPDSGASVASVGKAVTGLAAIALGAFLI